MNDDVSPRVDAAPVLITTPNAPCRENRARACPGVATAFGMDVPLLASPVVALAKHTIRQVTMLMQYPLRLAACFEEACSSFFHDLPAGSIDLHRRAAHVYRSQVDLYVV